MNTSPFVFVKRDFGKNYFTFSGTPPTFQDKENIENVYFGDVTTLPANAFRSIASLKKVQFPEVTTMGTAVFYATANVEIIELPKLTILPASSLNGCYFLKTLVLGSPGNPVTSIASNAMSTTTAKSVIDHEINWVIYTSTGTALSGYPWGASRTNVPESSIEWKRA